MNNVVLMGRLTKDPSIRKTGEGEKTMTFANYRLAVDRRFKREGQPDADFFDCVAIGRNAEFVEKYLHQGTKIAVVGRLQNNNFKGQDGQMIYRTEVFVESHEFAEAKKDQSASQAPADTEQQTLPDPEPVSDPDGFMQIPDGIDDELPFN